VIDQRIAEKVVQQFGRRVIAYVCNVDEEDVDSLVKHSSALNSVRARVLEKVIITLLQARMQAAYEGFPTEMFVSLMNFNREDGRHQFNVWREEAGGELPSFHSEDPVLQALADLAVDEYPFLLLTRSRSAGSFPYQPTSSNLFRHPASAKFQAAVLDDERLSLLFPKKGADSLSTRGSYRASTGLGGGHQLVVLSSSLLRAGYVLTRLKTADLQPISLFDSLATVIEMARKAAQGQVVPVPAFVGFSNIALEAPPAQLPWGVIKKYSERYAEFTPPEAQPSTWTPPNEAGAVAAGFILETTYPYELNISDEDSEDATPEWPASLVTGRQELDYHCELTSLALSLAIERNPPAAAHPAWTLIFDPLTSSGASTSWRLPVLQQLEPYFVKDSDDIQGLIDWARLLASTDDTKIRITQRRLLTALSYRQDAVDGFIDAVVAWENLFGSGQGELAFRVSAAMASLLERDAKNRLNLQRRISKQYNLRSKVVHGGQELTGERAIQERNEALTLLVRALRKLYRDHSHLINREERAREIILTL